MKCPNCRSENIENFKDEFETPKSDYRGKKIIVKDVTFKRCLECEESWLTESAFDFIQSKTDEQMHVVMTPTQIKEVRESLPLKTKYELANFLCFNEKAFVKWEKGRVVQNRANDLLIRLVAFSEENFNFVKKLHENKFEFNLEDYYFTNRKYVNANSGESSIIPERVPRTHYKYVTSKEFSRVQPDKIDKKQAEAA